MRNNDYTDYTVHHKNNRNTGRTMLAGKKLSGVAQRILTSVLIRYIIVLLSASLSTILSYSKDMGNIGWRLFLNTMFENFDTSES